MPFPLPFYLHHTVPTVKENTQNVRAVLISVIIAYILHTQTRDSLYHCADLVSCQFDTSYIHPRRENLN